MDTKTLLTTLRKAIEQCRDELGESETASFDWHNDGEITYTDGKREACEKLLGIVQGIEQKISLNTGYSYVMTDFQGRQVGNTYESYIPLWQLGMDMKEANDLVLWQVDENLTRRVIGVITPSTTSRVKSFRWS